MKFGPKQVDFPTPASVVLYTKIFIRVMSLGIILLQFVPMSDMWQHILSAVFGAGIGAGNDIQDWFGVKVSGNTVPTKDVDVIKDDAIK